MAEAETRGKKPGVRLCSLCNERRAALKRPKTLEQVKIPLFPSGQEAETEKAKVEVEDSLKDVLY